MSSLNFCSDFVPRASSALGHLDAHVAVVKDPTLRIDRRRPDDVALVVVAQLPGYPEGIAYPHGLSVPVRLLPGHPESPRLLWDWHTAPSPWSARWTAPRSRRPSTDGPFT